MSKCTEIREICGDYAFDVEYSKDQKFTMFFNSRKNAMTVKRCIEEDDKIPNVATAVDFVEVVRCKDCKNRHTEGCPFMFWDCGELMGETEDNDFCSYGERSE